MIDVGQEDEEEEAKTTAVCLSNLPRKSPKKTPLQKVAQALSPKKYAPSKLPPATRQLIKMIFDNDMFRETMIEMDIGKTFTSSYLSYCIPSTDVKKMPLGKLSKAQIVKGFEVLDEIKQVLEKGKKGNLTELSSRFYTVIPHDFGRQRPPVIGSQVGKCRHRQINCCFPLRMPSARNLTCC